MPRSFGRPEPYRSRSHLGSLLRQRVHQSDRGTHCRTTASAGGHRHSIDGLSARLVELKDSRRTLKRRATDMLALFTRPGKSNGSAQALMADSSICGDRLWDFVTSHTIFPAVSSRPVASDRSYILGYDEPASAGDLHRRTWYFQRRLMPIV